MKIVPIGISLHNRHDLGVRPVDQGALFDAPSNDPQIVSQGPA
jgi:hypothetical protein